MRKPNSKGITLIALVITIIVLLILAGVSVSMLTGENGILTRTTQVKEETRAARLVEEAKLWKTEMKMKQYENIKLVGILQEEFEKKLDELEKEQVINSEEKEKLRQEKIIQIGNQKIDFFLEGSYPDDGLVLKLNGYDQPEEINGTYYWKDASGNANDLELFNYTQEAYNQANKCIVFNGGLTGIYGATKQPIDFSNQEYTVVMILKPKRNATEFYYSNRNDTYNGISFLQTVDQYRVDNGSEKQVSYEFSFDKLQIANTYQQNQLKHYQGDVLKGTSISQYSTVNMNIAFHVGKHGISNYNYETAKMDCYQVLVYNRGLSEEEIKEIYQMNQFIYNI